MDIHGKTTFEWRGWLHQKSKVFNKNSEDSISGFGVHPFTWSAHRHTQTRNSLFMADVRERAVERDSVADINVEAVFPVGLVDSVIFCQRERLPLLTITYQTHMYRSTNKEKKKNTLKMKTPQVQLGTSNMKPLKQLATNSAHTCHSKCPCPSHNFSF